MTIAVAQDFEGATLDQYDRAIAEMGLEPGGKHSDPACLFHWVTATDTGLRVVDVWATREQFETFVAEQVAPRSLEAGFPNPPVKHVLRRTHVLQLSAIQNLVLADHCNLAKSDHLVTATHLDRWLTHLDAHNEALVDVTRRTRWISDPHRSRAPARSTYAHVSAGPSLWRHGTNFELATGPIHR
jgi:hypothetical protein